MLSCFLPRAQPQKSIFFNFKNRSKMTSVNYSKIQIHYSNIHNGNNYLPTTTFLNRTNRTTATNNKTVQFILSNARYFFLPIASLFDRLHSLSGISDECYKNQKYFILSLHCKVWLQLSILIAAFSSLAMFNPIMIELLNLQTELSVQYKRQFGIFELLLNLPTCGFFFFFFCFSHWILLWTYISRYCHSHLSTYFLDGYIQKFMFFQFFCFFHTVFVIAGFKTELPIYFAPTQMALLMFIVKLLIGFVKDMYFIMSDSLISFQRLTHGTYQFGRYDAGETEIQLSLFDNEVLPIVSAIIYVIFFMSVICFEYIIERSMQYMKYEYFITDTENYMREVIRRRFEKAQQHFKRDPPEQQLYHDPSFNPFTHLSQKSEVDVEME